MSEETPETPPPPPSSAYAPPANDPSVTTTLSKEAKNWALAAHLSPFAGFLIPVVGSIVPPLVIWQIKKEDEPFVADQAKESLNFQISVMIYVLVALVLCLVVIGAVLIPVIGICALIFMIIAAIAAGEGRSYRYPLTLRLIK